MTNQFFRLDGLHELRLTTGVHRLSRKRGGLVIGTAFSGTNVIEKVTGQLQTLWRQKLNRHVDMEYAFHCDN